MTDLTVLIAPNNLYPVSKSAFAFGLSAGRGRRSTGPMPRPVMVTLESDIESPPGYGETNPGQPQIAAPVPRGLPQDTTLLSPPINTFKAPQPRPRHRPTRSRSAPPSFSISPEQPAADTGQRALDDLSPPPLTAPFLPRPRRQSTFTRPRAGELVKPPPPLRELSRRVLHRSSLTTSLIASTPDNILAQDKAFGSNWCIILACITPRSAVNFHRSRP